jgi:hypothetical protein
MRIFRHHFSSYVFFLFAFASVSASAKSPGLCAANEKIVFSCELKNSKTVSICSSQDISGGYVEYRFGTKSNVELKYLADGKQRKLHRAEVVYANNSEDTIWFRISQFLYSIFIPTSGAPGLEVSRNNDVIARFECREGWTNATVDREAKSKFIIDHGTGDSSKFEKFWMNR